MILQADALEMAGALGEFDYVLTDPPYSTGGETSIRAKGGVAATREMIDGMCQSFIAGVLRSIKLKPDGCMWVMCDWRQVSFLSSVLRGMGYDKQSCIVWDKMTGGLSTRYRCSHEMILWATAVQFKVGNMGRDLVSMKRVSPSRKKHPFDKPPELVESVCKAFPPGRVIDPFCGAGGLLVGAKRLGWDVVGIDIDTKSVQTARERLS